MLHIKKQKKLEKSVEITEAADLENESSQTWRANKMDDSSKSKENKTFFWRNFFNNWKNTETIDKIYSIIIFLILLATITLLVICAISFDNGTKIVDLNRALINAKWSATSLGEPNGVDYSTIYNNSDGMFLLSDVGFLDYFLMQLSIIAILYSIARLESFSYELGFFDETIKLAPHYKFEWKKQSLLYTSTKAGIPAIIVTIALTLWPIIVVANSTTYSALLSSKYSIFFIVAHNYSTLWYVYAVFLISFLIAMLIRFISDIYRVTILRKFNMRDGSGRRIILSENIYRKSKEDQEESGAFPAEPKKSFWQEFDEAPTIEAAQEILNRAENKLDLKTIEDTSIAEDTIDASKADNGCDEQIQKNNDMDRKG